MKAIEHSIEIPAPPSAVWDVLTSFDDYAEWNPFLTVRAVPPLTVGNRLRITIRPGRRRISFRPTVTAIEPGREISWLGHFLTTGIFDGAHSLTVEPLPNGHTQFHQREVFRGVLVPFMKGVLRDTSAGFAAMNTALASRVTARAATGEL